MNLIPTAYDGPSSTWKCRHILLTSLFCSLNFQFLKPLFSHGFSVLITVSRTVSTLSLPKPMTCHLSPHRIIISFVLALNVSLPPNVFDTLPTLILHLQIWWTHHHCDVPVRDKHAEQDQTYLLLLETSFQVTSGLSVSATPHSLCLVSLQALTSPHAQCTGIQTTFRHGVLGLSWGIPSNVW